MPANWKKPVLKNNKQMSNAVPVFIFAFFYICILVLIESVT
jgi:hypothetical protein